LISLLTLASSMSPSDSTLTSTVSSACDPDAPPSGARLGDERRWNANLLVPLRQGRAGDPVRADLEPRRRARRRAPGRCPRAERAGASERPEHGYDFPLHAADALAVLAAAGIERASLVTASRGLNAAVLLIADDPERFGRLAAVAPYMRLEAEPASPDPERLEGMRTDWPGFIVPFMHNVFTEPGSADVIAEMIAIGLEATPEVVASQELELDWERPARLLGAVACPTLVVHGEADAAVPVSLVRGIVAAMPNARLELIPGGGHRPDIRTPNVVNPLLLDFLLLG
jgi:pimeloyl-ACP methyl ester carboxylesterase